MPSRPSKRPTCLGEPPKVSGWVFMLGAICAWYAGSAVLLASSWQRIVLPFGRLAKAAREREPQFIESGLHPAG
jgi:hypothetical protein